MTWEQSVLYRPFLSPGFPVNKIGDCPGILAGNGDALGFPLNRSPRLKVAKRWEILIPHLLSIRKLVPCRASPPIGRIEHPAPADDTPPSSSPACTILF